MMSSIRVKVSRSLEKVARNLADLGLGRFEILSGTYYALREITKPDKKTWVDFEGYKIYVDPTEFVGRRLYRESFHEDGLVDKILQEVQEGDKVADIGAHIGSTALIFRKAIGEDGKVFCFEPNPESFEMLQSTIEKNEFDNFELFNQALGDSNGKVNLKHDSENTGRSSIREAKNLDGTFNVDLVETKSKLEGLGELDWAKIDVEGAEYEIISNLGDSITMFKGMFLELHLDRLSDNELKQIYEILSTNGEIYTFNDLSAKEIMERPKDNLDVVWKNNVGEDIKPKKNL